jgi:hypothetical protein
MVDGITQIPTGCILDRGSELSDGLELFHFCSAASLTGLSFVILE